MAFCEIHISVMSMRPFFLMASWFRNNNFKPSPPIYYALFFDAPFFSATLWLTFFRPYTLPYPVKFVSKWYCIVFLQYFTLFFTEGFTFLGWWMVFSVFTAVFVDNALSDVSIFPYLFFIDDAWCGRESICILYLNVCNFYNSIVNYFCWNRIQFS
jgi:hypothetical protein